MPKDIVWRTRWFEIKNPNNGTTYFGDNGSLLETAISNLFMSQVELQAKSDRSQDSFTKDIKQELDDLLKALR